MSSAGFDWRSGIEKNGPAWGEFELKKLEKLPEHPEWPKLKREIDKYKQEQEDKKFHEIQMQNEKLLKAQVVGNEIQKRIFWVLMVTVAVTIIVAIFQIIMKN